MKHTDLDRIWRHGQEIVEVRKGKDPTDVDVMWALFCEAVRTSGSLPAPPRMSFPQKSAMPESPDEITWFQTMRAYLMGELTHAPDTPRPKINPSAAQMTRHDVIMALWHRYALRGMGDWKRQRKALWNYAGGSRSAKICREYGFTRTSLARLKKKAMEDLIAAVAKSQKLR